jgi:hypothetical protein
MAVRHKTPFTPNKVYFLTFTAFRWYNIFTNDKYCDLIYKWFDYTKNNYGNKKRHPGLALNHFGSGLEPGSWKIQDPCLRRDDVENSRVIPGNNNKHSSAADYPADGGNYKVDVIDL